MIILFFDIDIVKTLNQFTEKEGKQFLLTFSERTIKYIFLNVSKNNFIIFVIFFCTIFSNKILSGRSINQSSQMYSDYKYSNYTDVQFI